MKRNSIIFLLQHGCCEHTIAFVTAIICTSSVQLTEELTKIILPWWRGKNCSRIASYV